jgi:predicted metal-dependent peptidase
MTPAPSISPERLAELKRATLAELSRCRQRFLLKFPFTAAVMMRFDLVAVRDKRLRTASTDGRKIYFDVSFCEDLPPEERMFVLAHEVWHGILLHMLRGKGLERERFNRAADMEVNRLLRSEGIPVPRFALMPEPKWGDISAEEMYDKITVSRRRGAGPDKTQPGVDGQFDEHIRDGDNPDDEGDSRRFAVWDKWGEVGYDRDYVPLVAVDVAEGIRAATLAAAQQIERQQGNLPRHLKGVVGRLLKGRIDWREQLAQFVTNAFGGSRRWLPPSRRHIGRGLYLQSSRQERLKAVVAIDTSGSTTCDLPRFFGELQGLLATFGSYEITVIQCDAEVQHVESFDETRTVDVLRLGLEELEFYGGGGTSFSPVFEYVAEHPELEPSVLIYITDGYGSVSVEQPPYPVMWLLTPDGVKPAVWGVEARLEQ